MDYKTVLRHQPELRLYNTYNISGRLLEMTNGDAFIAYNTLKNVYELHTVSAYKINQVSANTKIDQDYLNGFLIKDFKAKNNRRFMSDNLDNKKYREHLYDQHAESNKFMNTSGKLKIVERTLGIRL